MLLLLAWLFWLYYERDEDGEDGGRGALQGALKLHVPPSKDSVGHENAAADLYSSENCAAITATVSDGLYKSYILTSIDDGLAGSGPTQIELTDGVHGATAKSRKIVEENVSVCLTDNLESQFEMNFDNDLDSRNGLVQEDEIISSTSGIVEEEVVPLVSSFEESQFGNESLHDYDIQLDPVLGDSCSGNDVKGTVVIDSSHPEVVVVPMDLECQYASLGCDLDTADVDADNPDIFDDDYEVSAAIVTSGAEEVMEASLSKNRLSSLIEGQNEGQLIITGKGKSKRKKNKDPEVKSSLSSENKLSSSDSHISNSSKASNDVVSNNGNGNVNNNNNSSSSKSGSNTNHNITSSSNDNRSSLNEKGSNKVYDADDTSGIRPGSSKGKMVEVNQIQASTDDNALFTEQSNRGEKKSEPGKLGTKKRGTKPIATMNQPSAKLTDFDKIMRSRKMHTDTMDMTATVLGNLGHRKEKIKGKKLSRYWDRLHDAVSNREYLAFADKEIPPNDEKNE